MDIEGTVSKAAVGFADALLAELAGEEEKKSEVKPARADEDPYARCERFMRWALPQHPNLNFSRIDWKFASSTTQEVFNHWVAFGEPDVKETP